MMLEALNKQLRDEHESRGSFSRLPSFDDFEDVDLRRLDASRARRRPPWLWVTSLILVAFGAWALGVWMAWSRLKDGADCQPAGSASPVLEGVPDGDIAAPVRFNGSFFNETVFRREAGPEVDAVWEALGVDYRPSVIPEDYAESAGIGPGQVRVSDKYGGGFIANVEGLHHLHCLNLLRQSLYFNYEYYQDKGAGAFKNEEEVLRVHITHCVDILRQQLMCKVDTGLLGQVWWNRDRPQAFPDFNTQHRCRDFEAVRQWAEQNQAPVDVAKDYLRSPRREDVLESIP